MLHLLLILICNMYINKSKRLRVLLLFSAIMTLSSLAYPFNWISRTYLAGNDQKKVSDTIETANELTFEHVYESWVGRWDVLYLGYDGEYHSIFDVDGESIRPQNETHSFTFKRFSDSRSDPHIPKQAAKIYTDKETPLYYMVKLVCEFTHPGNGDTYSDSIFLRLGIPTSRPSVPEIIGMKYENIVYDWKLDSMLDSEFYIDIKCEDAIGCTLWYNTQCSFVNSEDVFLNIYEPFQLDNNGTAHYRFEDADWGTIMKFAGYNDLGHGEWTDRYFTTDYIDDPEVLARIEEMKNIKNGLQEIKQVRIPISDNISINDGYIYCTGEVASLEIYDLNGSLVATQHGAGLIRTSHFPHGVYIINYTESNGTTRHQKVSIN